MDATYEQMLDSYTERINAVKAGLSRFGVIKFDEVAATGYFIGVLTFDGKAVGSFEEMADGSQMRFDMRGDRFYSTIFDKDAQVVAKTVWDSVDEDDEVKVHAALVIAGV